jgi:hypothetical protein
MKEKLSVMPHDNGEAAIYIDRGFYHLNLGQIHSVGVANEIANECNAHADLLEASNAIINFWDTVMGTRPEDPEADYDDWEERTQSKWESIESQFRAAIAKAKDQ